MKLIVLGSGGWFPSDYRNTASFLIVTENTLIILDAGTGISRLNNYQSILNKYAVVHLILSHYHLDHTIGLTYLPNWLHNKNLFIYAPGKNLVSASAVDILSSLIRQPYFSPLKNLAEKVIVYDYDLNGFKINEIQINITEQTHTNKSYGITIGNNLHYATDTVLSDAEFKIAQNTNLLLHDSWILKE